MEWRHKTWRWIDMKKSILAAIVLGTLLLASSPALGALGSLGGNRVQAVATDAKPIDVATVNCFDFCRLTWESFGPSRLTVRCLDGTEETSTVVFPGRVQLSHPCILESTLELRGATESVVLWRASP